MILTSWKAVRITYFCKHKKWLCFLSSGGYGNSGCGCNNNNLPLLLLGLAAAALAANGMITIMIGGSKRRRRSLPLTEMPQTLGDPARGLTRAMDLAWSGRWRLYQLYIGSHLHGLISCYYLLLLLQHSCLCPPGKELLPACGQIPSMGAPQKI